MNNGFYWKIAKTNIKNNRKIYFPYILTSIGMVMIFYIVGFLAHDNDIRTKMNGGATLQSLLKFGIWVIAIFAVLFLWYTNSFIAKRRKKEFGLFHVLGMGKKNIARVMFCEGCITNGVSVVGGLLLGVVFSKLVQGILYRLMQYDLSSLRLSVDTDTVLATLLLFCGVFLLIYLDSLRQIAFSNTIELLHGAQTGEREPRANWILAALGAICLAIGYYIAVSTEDPVAATMLFFIAVVFVILGTYGLFISGSVAILKLLKKNKTYYYSPQHFISVSGMTYRMKRNGAGLASICILSTMVLVMLSSTFCMFVGMDNGVNLQYPMDMTVTVYNANDPESFAMVQEAVEGVLAEKGVQVQKKAAYHVMSSASFVTDGAVSFQWETTSENYARTVLTHMLTIDAYNAYRLKGDAVQLAENEVYLLCDGVTYPQDTITIEGTTYTVKGSADLMTHFPLLSTADYLGMPHLSVFFADQTAADRVFHAMYPEMDENYRIPLEGGEPGQTYSLYFAYIGLDLDTTDSVLLEELCRTIFALFSDADNPQSIYRTNTPSCRPSTHADQYHWVLAMYGGLLFIAVILGLVFVCGEVLIIYYKQVTEGYEDVGRFAIMRKVGMTEREIRKSIRHQILTVFFLPLFGAGLHTLFAFPMLEKLLKMMVYASRSLFLTTLAICFAIFTVFYVLVYLITSKAYTRIIDKGQTQVL